MSLRELEIRLQKALGLDLPYHRPGRTLRETVTPAAVLILFAFSREGGAPRILLTRRAESLETHKGQIAFPGGVSDPEDHESQGAITTALREAQEEVGLDTVHVRVIGSLPELNTTTGFLVQPIVATTAVPIEELSLRPNPDEIAEIFWARLDDLPQAYRKEAFVVGNISYPVHAYYVPGAAKASDSEEPHRVWGATGAMLKNLLDRLAALG